MAARIKQRELALVVYGATGFTGKFVAEHVARSQARAKGSKLAWGIAGRSSERLQDVVKHLRDQGLPCPDTVILADVNDATSLDEMSSRAALVMNCTGPYRFLGEQVVSSCVRCGADYVDLCGEPEFMDRMLLKYDQQAKDNKVLVIHACAFDSVPADMGVVFASKQFAPPAVISSVESYLTLDTGGHGLHGHYTTYEAAVHGFGGARELVKLRMEVGRKYRFDDKAFLYVTYRFDDKAWRIGPPLKAKPWYFDPRLQRHCFRFPGSDASVVRSSQRQLVLCNLVKPPEKLPRYSAYFTTPSTFWAYVTAGVGWMFSALAVRSWGRKLLLRFPRLFTLGAFSHKGPSEEELAAAKFSMTFYARGYSGPHATEQRESSDTPLVAKPAVPPPDKEVVTRVSGPEPGYVATPIIFVELARCLLEERASLPVQGGVFTPAAVFKDSTLVERLKAAGIDFTVVQA